MFKSPELVATLGEMGARIARAEAKAQRVGATSWAHWDGTRWTTTRLPYEAGDLAVAGPDDAWAGDSPGPIKVSSSTSIGISPTPAGA